MSLFIGGIVGGAVFFLSIALVVFFFLRRRLYSTISKERPVNVLQDHEDGDGSNHDLPMHYAPEPFLVPNPTITGTSEAAFTQERRLSMATTDAGRPQTPVTATSTATRKSAAPPQSPPVNIIQHDDAGPSEDPASYVTIELPPTYSKLPRTPRSPLATPTTADTT
jgi:hypothetical protein